MRSFIEKRLLQAGLKEGDFKVIEVTNSNQEDPLFVMSFVVYINDKVFVLGKDVDSDLAKIIFELKSNKYKNLEQEIKNVYDSYVETGVLEEVFPETLHSWEKDKSNFTNIYSSLMEI